MLKLLFPNANSVLNKCNYVDHTCTHCLYGKMHNQSFPNSQFVATSPFELVHSDLWGPTPINSVNGFRYYVLFIDHYTRFTWLYLLKSKSEVFTKFTHFKAMIETPFSAKIKIFRSDRGGEYTSNVFKTYLLQQGIIHQLSCPNTPQQNGLVERKHKHLIETSITLLSQAFIPSSYWSYAIQTAISLINLLPTSVLKFHSPWFKLYSTKPDLSQLKVFGCARYPNLRPYTSHKLEPRTVECIFLGYPTGFKGYLYLNISSTRFYISRHVVFNESKFPFSTLTVSPSVPTSSHVHFDTLWLSNQLYLHSLNHPSLLGAFHGNVSSQSSSLPPPTSS